MICAWLRLSGFVCGCYVRDNVRCAALCVVGLV